jgi:hypothetical protein
MPEKRDDFSTSTKDKLAKRVGYRCSNPECRCATVGAAQGHDGFIVVGVAAHITAAAPGGPRFDASMTPEQRRDPSNGIWLCQTHAKLIDSDASRFSVETLHQWKLVAEARSFRALVAQPHLRDQQAAPEALDAAVQELVDRLGLPPEDDVLSVTTRLLGAATADLEAFKRMPGWPRHAVPLNLRMTQGGNERAFHAEGLAAALDSFNEIAVIAPPGTGKTTTLVQVASAVLSAARSVAVYVPLGEWSSQRDSLLQSILRRAAFRDAREQHFMLLAHHGRLVLIFDGWNELDSEARKRAAAEIARLRRDFPRLGIIVSTRRQALHVPISGPVVEIDVLTADQQLEIASALQGERGEALIDHALRTPGVRDLVSIPLYLSALLARTTDGRMPTTKEQVLRLFVTEHERQPDKAAALRETLFDFHPHMLTALAVEATRSGNTAISDTRARIAVAQVEQGLVAAGQMVTAPQPTNVLDVLVSQHMLVRSGAESAVSFQHQQFQEWYASFEVERVMRAAAAGGDAARHRLRVEMLNLPPWEESILFACERLARLDRAGAEAVSSAVVLALSIDPMLAAEMIYRSPVTVWNEVRDRVMAFMGRWRVPGSVDRAVRFMITSGRDEFADRIWNLISDPDTQVHLRALRAAKRFRPSVLGLDVSARLARVPEQTRKNILAEIAMRGGIDGIELAAKVAEADPSAAVQLAVIEALLFRWANRYARAVLGTASQEVWQLLAKKGYAEEIADITVADRLRTDRQRQIATETNPMAQLALLLQSPTTSTIEGEQVREAIAASDFPRGDQHAAWRLNDAFKRYPKEVATALLRRLEAGLELPFHAERFLESVPAIDDGPVTRAAIDTDTKRLGFVAATVVGPKTTGLLIDAFLVIARSPGRADRAAQEQYRQLLERLAATRISSLIPALLARSNTTEPQTIGLLAEILVRHGTDETREQRLLLDGDRLLELIAVVRTWVDTLFRSPGSTRYQLVEVASAIGRLGRPELVPELKRLLGEDLSRWRHARQARLAAPATATIQLRSDAAHSWTLQYRQALSRIGDDQVVQLAGEYLEDRDFGFDAACVLWAIWNSTQNIPKPAWNKRWPDFSDVSARRLQRSAGVAFANASPLAEMIFAAIDRLVRSGAPDRDQLAIKLGRIALAIPHGDKTAILNALLAVPQPIRTKRELLAALVLDGEIISADLVLEGVRAWIDEADTNTWMSEHGVWELEGWLELLPFSDRPAATIEGLQLANAALAYPHRMERLVSVVGGAPGSEAEDVLLQMARRYPQLADQHDWVQAFVRRGTASAGMMLIDLVLNGGFPSGHGPLDGRWIADQLSALAQTHPEFKSDVIRRYRTTAGNTDVDVIECTIAKLGDHDSLMVIVRAYAANGKGFDRLLKSAIHDAALSQEPAAGWTGAYELRPMALAGVRKELFAMLSGQPSEAALARACLTKIDKLRDEYGAAEFEPRHPDAESGRPWPLAAEEL